MAMRTAWQKSSDGCSGGSALGTEFHNSMRIQSQDSDQFCIRRNFVCGSQASQPSQEGDTSGGGGLGAGIGAGGGIAGIGGGAGGGLSQLSLSQSQRSENLSMSLGLGTQDYLTPKDAEFAQFGSTEDPADGAVRPAMKGIRSPTKLTPCKSVRMKRLRMMLKSGKATENALYGSDSPLTAVSQSANLTQDASDAPKNNTSEKSFHSPPPKQRQKLNPTLSRLRQSPPVYANLYASQVEQLTPRANRKSNVIGQVEDEDNRKAGTLKRPDLAESSLPKSRYVREFSEISEIGTGSFNKVMKVRNRIDGCFYAVKRTKFPIEKPADWRQAINEVHALSAVCGNSHQHLIRYYSAWEEHNHVYIQLELCRIGIKEFFQGFSDEATVVNTVWRMLSEMSSALHYLHARKMICHLDIKPDNIFVGYGQDNPFKLGDFGCAVQLQENGSPKFVDCDIREGDCRYLPTEVLNGEYTKLPSADIFSLGMTAHELMQGPCYQVPREGQEFELLRKASVSLSFSPENKLGLAIEHLLIEMLSPQSQERPSAHEISDYIALTTKDLEQQTA